MMVDLLDENGGVRGGAAGGEFLKIADLATQPGTGVIFGFGSALVFDPLDPGDDSVKLYPSGVRRNSMSLTFWPPGLPTMLTNPSGAAVATKSAEFSGLPKLPVAKIVPSLGRTTMPSKTICGRVPVSSCSNAEEITAPDSGSMTNNAGSRSAREIPSTVLINPFM